jgi:phosphate transport system permease protein
VEERVAISRESVGIERLRRRQRVDQDGWFRIGLRVVAGIVVVLVIWMIVDTFSQTVPIWERFGIVGFVTGTRWAPSFTIYGAWPFIYGTLLTSAIAMIIAVPIAVLIALLISEFLPARARDGVGITVDMLAAIPSVVYGLWGLLVLVPFLRPFEQAVASTIGTYIPFLSGPTPGPSYFAAGVIVSIMVIPIIAALSREVFAATPRLQRDAVQALGGTRWDVIRDVVLPIGRSGVIAAVVLGLARAIGETIAVTLVIGNSTKIGTSIFSPGFTLASVIANEFNEANQELHPEALIALGLILLVISVLVNGAAILIRQRFAGGVGRVA